MTPETARKSSAEVPNQSASASSFLGRRAEIAAVLELLDGARLVTLTGPPGIGKSRLALAVASERSDGQSSDVPLVELAPVGDPALVPAAFAASLSVQEVPGEALTETVIARLGDRQLLLVLDNCEHLRMACGQLAGALLEACPHLTVLATSREPLAIPGELVWHVPPLSLPARSDRLPPERLMDYEAVRLFVERARAAEPGFALTDYTAAAVVEICLRLDGIPLPIELAAARVESLTPAEIAGRLDDRFDLLTDRGGRPARHRALETAVDWSYELLSGPERAVLRRLSLFVGGFELEAAAAVCAGEGVTAATVPALVERLISKSLVVRSGETGHHRLLETIRAYAGERLEESGEVRATREAHARFYMELAEEAEPQLAGEAQQRWFERLERERPNLRAALEWSVVHGQGEWALRLAGALVLFWQVRGHFSEGRELLAAALASGDGAAAGLRAKARWGEGFLVLMGGDIDGAVPLLEESLARFSELGDIRGRARALLLLGNCRQLRNEPSGLSLVEESVGLAREAGDSWCLATALGVAGAEYAYRDNLVVARSLFEECLTVARAIGDRHGLRIGLVGLGRVALREGDHRSAEPLLEECVTVADEMGELYAKATAMRHLAEAAFMRGDYTRTRELIDEAMPLLYRFGPVVPALVLRARVARAEGQPQAARRLLEEALRLARSGAANPAALHGMGELVADEGNPAAARRLFEEALEVGRASQDRLAVARALKGLGEVARERGETKRAGELHNEALELQQETGSCPGIVASLEAVAALAVDVGRHQHGARLLAAAQRVREENGYVRAPWERARYERALALARDRLSDEEFGKASDEGVALSIEEAVDEASAGSGPPNFERSGWSSLSESELQVVALAAEGLTNPEIAERLVVSLSTVKRRLESVFLKLGVTRRSELIRDFPRHQHQTPEADI